MKIIIDLTKKESDHIRGTHTFYDCCNEVSSIMEKVQDKVNKAYKKRGR